MSTREQLIAETRKWLGVKFSHQGRNRATGIDCGGLMLVATRAIGILDLEFLGYAKYPTEGKFEELLAENSDLLFESVFPFNFTGDEMLPGDMISFDYDNNEGTRHLALVTGWDGRRYKVIEAQPGRGVCEHALAPPFVKTKMMVKGWRLRGLA